MTVKTKTISPDFLSRIPKWLLPILVIIMTGLVFFIGQFVADLVLSLYVVTRGWTQAYANNWLANSVAAQFAFVLIAETITVSQVYLVLRYFGKNLSRLGLGKKFKPIWLLYALLGYPAYLLLYLALQGVVVHLYPGLNVNQTQQIGFSSVHGTYQLILTFFSLVILPPIAEEILFRGFLYEGLKKSMPLIYAAVLTSALFASAHLPEGGAAGPLWIGAIDTFTLSVVLVFLKQKTKSLWPGMCLHALKNLVAFVALFLLSNR